jgi:hypothetical protein
MHERMGPQDIMFREVFGTEMSARTVRTVRACEPDGPRVCRTD